MSGCGPAAHRPPHAVAGDCTRCSRRCGPVPATPRSRASTSSSAPRLAATAIDVLDADGYLLGTPANLGYMSGALKHFFDQIYYPCLDATVGRPFGFWVHGNDDTTGAVRAIEVVTTGLRWRLAQAPVSVVGDADRGRCRRVLGARRRARRRAHLVTDTEERAWRGQRHGTAARGPPDHRRRRPRARAPRRHASAPP